MAESQSTVGCALPTETVLQRLAAVLENRKHADSAHSYVAHLYSRGANAILKKVGTAFRVVRH